ncbi:glycoside hydrolase family 31 protein [Xylanimonas sp. McL0601]|uniref:glycoside hydrolase family 31 protein n=1 Tax=Xylanimonas sp. McL0601 TaxID=3414739 RepID=UPI003CF205BC
MTLTIPLLDGELWWGGAVADASAMPFHAGTRHSRDLAHHSGALGHEGGQQNQSAPVLVSSGGRYVASSSPFVFTFDGGVLSVVGGDVVLGETGGTLRDAYREASATFFPPSGATPARELFTGPQYNTWIEMPFTPTQESVLAYVRRMLDDGMPPGVVMIDDCWAVDYGVWSFDLARFPDPRGMVEQLHAWGCRVMLWVVPFVSADSFVFRTLEAAGLLIRDASGGTAVRRWWNGFSALLDLSNPASVSWLCDRLDALVELGVDGFKFDAGDLDHYRDDDVTVGGYSPVEMCEAWARVGLRYPFNEYRACWRMGGQGLAQRLHDRPPSWGSDGIAGLVPALVTQGLIGLAYSCPDMVGGGELDAMAGVVDQELFVRYAQVAALSPMMQFSLSPSRVLDEERRAAVMRALELRAQLRDEVVRLVDEAAATGEPVVRAMGYHEPELAGVTDQFFLGADVVVAPVVERGARTRTVQVPAGEWVLDDGTALSGPGSVELEVPLERVPVLRRAATTGR